MRRNRSVTRSPRPLTGIRSTIGKMTEEPIVIEPRPRPDPFAPPPQPQRAELHLELRCNGELIAESGDEKLWARVLVLLLEAERPEYPR